MGGRGATCWTSSTSTGRESPVGGVAGGRSRVKEAAEWYAARAAALGSGFSAAIRDTLEVIEQAPDRFPMAIDDIRKARVQRFPYVVYYVVLSDVISVIAIIHGRRDPRRWQTRR